MRFDDKEKLFTLPKLVIHQDCESIFNAHWNFENDQTFEELLDSKCGGEDAEGNELEEITLRQVFESTKSAGFWAFSNSIKKEIHIWEGDLSFEELLVVIGHELGHIAVAEVIQIGDMTDYAFEEDVADCYGITALWAHRLALEVRGAK